jgi:3-isopropylmalate dehydrogenase
LPKAESAARVVLLPGDGIGPEVAAEARLVLEALAPEVELDERLIGAAAIRASGTPLPDETRDACLAAVAVLKGPVGDPEFDAADVRPEQGLLALRAALDTYANLRPAVADGVDVLIVRELVGGLYFGARGVRDDGTVYDTCEYHPNQVVRIVRRAFQLARSRRGLLTSVDKANVLETSRLWRRVVGELAPDYPDVRVEHMLVDNAAMQLATGPERFDVLVTENMFGDILSDLAAAVTGGLGLAPSASLSDGGPGIFEPVHGSAPDIAGRGLANPTAMLRSTALLLEHGLARPDEARRLSRAIEVALSSTPTADLGGDATTAELGAAIRAQLGVDGFAAATYGEGDASRA